MSRVITPDICVIGAGSAGLSVAAAARAFGVEVAICEEAAMGGDCLNSGCIPSKSLIAAARHAHAIRTAAGFGVHPRGPGAAGDPVATDMEAVRAHIRAVIAGIAPHDSQSRFEGLGATVIRARARFTDPRTVVAGDTTIRARRFVVATGSRPALPPVPGLTTVPHLTNESVFDLGDLPAHLVVLGGGPIGLELAQAFRRLGAEVTVIEAARALGRDDPELAAVVLARLRAEGVTVLEQTRASGVVADSAGGVRVETLAADGTRRTLSGSHLLVAAGRRPNVEDLGLEAGGIGFGPRGIRVDAGLRTGNRHVYAIGDVAGSFQFTHWAGYHAGLAVRSILFRLPVAERRDILPWVTFTDPEIGQVGLSADAARAAGHSVTVLSSPYVGNDRAATTREAEGLFKLVVGRGGRILGAAAAGPEAGETLAMMALAIGQKLTVKAFADTVFPYPTHAEIARRAALTYYGKSLANPWIGRLLRALRAFG